MTFKHLSIMAVSAILLGTGSVITWLFPDALAEITASQADATTQVASIIEKGEEQNQPPQSDAIPADPLKAPPVDGPNTHPDDTEIYNFFMSEEQPVRIEAASEGEEASVFINDLEVVRFRKEVAGIEPYSRAQIMTERLVRYLQNGNGPEDIKPAKKGGLVVIRMGDEVLTTVDANNAMAAGIPRDQLALVWANRIRESLGGTGLTTRNLPDLFPLAEYQATGQVQTGMASWYGGIFHGRRTASGARFNQYALTAAHRTLPFGTMVKVTNQRTRKSCIVKITDRGPYAHGRIIDLSKGAASAIGLSGVGSVKLEVVKPNT